MLLVVLLVYVTPLLAIFKKDLHFDVKAYTEAFSHIDRTVLLKDVESKEDFWEDAEKIGSNIKNSMVGRNESYEKFINLTKKCFNQNWSPPIREHLIEIVMMLTEIALEIYKTEKKGTYIERLEKPVRLEHFIDFAKRILDREERLEKNNGTKEELNTYKVDCEFGKDLNRFVSMMNSYDDMGKQSSKELKNNK